MSFADAIRRIFGRMLPKQSLEKKLNVQIATSGVMDNAIQLWLSMYKNTPSWAGGKENITCLNLPAAIAEELARLVLTEFELDMTGSARATFIKEQLEGTLNNLSNIIEMWCALGGIVLKPYASGEDENGNPDGIMVDIVQANRFYPTAFNSNKDVTGAVFVDTKRIGDYVYTRLEHHNLEGDHYTVINKAFRSERLNTMTTEDDQISVEHPFMQEVPLNSVDEWSGLEPITEMDGIEHPFFVYIKIPRANTVDPQSPLGSSVYSRATDVIKEADRQYTRILWEYEAKEAAIDADETLFNTDRSGKPILPRGRERQYRTYDFGGTEKTGFIQAYSPEIRDSSLFNGLNKLFRTIELLCGLSYGTISDTSFLSGAERSATEIKYSKHRSYTVVNKMQQALESGLNDLILVMGIVCSLYGLVPEGAIETKVTWGDGILEDTELEYQRRWAMVMAGKLKLEKFYAWYFGCTEEAAKELIPEPSPSLYPPAE